MLLIIHVTPLLNSWFLVFLKISTYSPLLHISSLPLQLPLLWQVLVSLPVSLYPVLHLTIQVSPVSWTPSSPNAVQLIVPLVGLFNDGQVTNKMKASYPHSHHVRIHIMTNLFMDVVHNEFSTLWLLVIIKKW